MHVTFHSPGGALATITSTRFHPFWTSNRGWVEAKDITNDDQFADPNGIAMPVAAAEIEYRLGKSYNLSINGIHTYFVAADGFQYLYIMRPIPDPAIVPDPNGSSTFWHYTNQPESNFASGLNAGTSVTDNGNMMPWEAMSKLGIPQPNKAIPITGNPGDFVPQPPVPASGYRTYTDPITGKSVSIPVAGGANEWTNPNPIPPNQVGKAKPLS